MLRKLRGGADCQLQEMQKFSKTQESSRTLKTVLQQKGNGSKINADTKTYCNKIRNIKKLTKT